MLRTDDLTYSGNSSELPPYYEEKLTTNYPVVQAIPLMSEWYLFNSSCAHRSVFLCNSCFQQGSEYTQVNKNWFPRILIHNQCCNQQLWIEEIAPIHMLSLQCSFEYLSMLDELAFMRRKQLPISIIYFHVLEKICSKLLAYTMMHFLTASFRL